MRIAIHIPYWKMGELKHFEFGKMGVCGSKNESHSQISQWVWIEQEPDFAGTIGFDVIMWCKMSTSGWHLAWTFLIFLQIHWGDRYELRRSVHPGDLPFTDGTFTRFGFRSEKMDLKLDPKLGEKTNTLWMLLLFGFRITIADWHPTPSHVCVLVRPI